MYLYTVALFTRAWIEIEALSQSVLSQPVALFTRAWIEMFLLNFMLSQDNVALFTRAWIEMPLSTLVSSAIAGRPLHEGVD